MIPAGAEYQEYEALQMGATPAVRISFSPYTWPNGVNALGTFVECAYVPPDRIQAHYHGFSGGYWISEVITSYAQFESPAVITWNWNAPGFDLVVYWRYGNSAAECAAASWEAIESGDTLIIPAFYQFKITMEGYRAWAVDAVGDADAWTAYAETTPLEDEYQGYAAPVNVPGILLTYIEALELPGEFMLMADIEEVGTITQEAPTDFSDLVGGDLSGLILNNRQVGFA